MTLTRQNLISYDFRIIREGRGIQLRDLFVMTDFRNNKDVHERLPNLQCFSVAEFLLGLNPPGGGRAGLLRFVELGMGGDGRGWDTAAQEVYGFHSVEALEKAWLNRLTGMSEPPLLAPLDGPVPSARPSANEPTPSGFAVYGPSDAVTRALQAEVAATRQRLAEKWVGGGLPDTPKYRLQVGYSRDAEGRYPTAEVEIKLRTEPRRIDTNTGPKTYHATVAETIEIRLRGELHRVLEYDLPAIMVRAVVVEKHGRDVPPWATCGLGLVEVSRIEQREADTRLRRLASDGKLVRLSAFFETADWKPDDTRDQGYSVIRFLLNRQPRARQHQAVAEFLRTGGGGWSQAAKDVYGFHDVDDLEAAWLTWLKSPASTADLPIPSVHPKPSPPAPPRIPPLNLGPDVPSTGPRG